VSSWREEEAIDPRLRQLMVFEVQRARALLLDGLRLRSLVQRRLSRELLLFAGGGLAILAKIEAADYDVFRRRPALTRWEKAALVLRAGAGLHQTAEDLR
jgi:phytoene synthase